MPPAAAKRRRSVAEEAAALAAAVAAATAAAEAKAASAAATREEAFICSICTGLLTAPISTTCGHTFCKDCLGTWLATKAKCPLCNAAVSSALPLVNKALESAIEANAGPLFLAHKAAESKTRPFLDALAALDPAAARAALDPLIDMKRFVGDASRKMTPLLWACANAKGDNVLEWTKLAEDLIARPDVDVQARCADGLSALSHVAKAGRVTSTGCLVPILLAKGVRDNAALGHAMWFTWVSSDKTSDRMVRFGDVLTLLAKDCSMLALSAAERSSVLKITLVNGFDNAAVALLDHGIRTADPKLALRCAAAGGCATAIKLLCKVPNPIVPVDTIFSDEQTALHVACSFGHAAASLSLLEAGASKFNRDDFKYTPMK